MDSALFQAFLGFLVILGCFVAPVILVWGWIRWIRRPKQRTVTSIASLIGFLLASASAVLAVASVADTYIHGFDYIDPLWLKVYRTAARLSLAGLVFSLGGVWRPNALRWHSPVSAIGTLAFWFAWVTLP